MKFAGLAGQGLDVNADDAADVLEILNGMLDAWTMDRLFVYNVRFDVYALTSNQQSYTIGQSGSPNFNAVRPNKLENANIVITSQTPNIRRPLYLMDDDDWANISLRALPTPTIPTALYFSRDFPNATLNFWPTPQSGLSVELETWQVLSQFAALTDTFSFPPGYYEAVYQNLGLRLCTPEYGMEDVPPTVALAAQQSRARIESLNMDPPPQLKIDSGLQGVRNTNPGQQLFNIKNPAPQWYR
jgi:hypothetical protein